MLLRRFYDDKLAAASYLLGCPATGEALIVDPLRDVDRYVAAAREEGLRVTHVTETHIHADFLSGARELASRTGARLLLSGEGGEDWKYAFARGEGVVLLRDGDAFRVGNLELEVWHTPGHTPEHIIFLVTDGAGADRPMGALTGDFVFVGDVGRPDLLETAAGIRGTMESGARSLFRSLRRFRALPDYLQIWPGHGAGSACGKALGAVPQSTLGYEKMFGWAFAHDDEEAFVRAVLEGQPTPPPYFAVMKTLNRDGPPAMPTEVAPPRLPDGEISRVLERQEWLVDLRGTRAFAREHLPGTVNIPMGRSFLQYAGAVLDHDRDLYLLGDEGPVVEAARDLALVGYDRVKGWFGPEARGATARLVPSPELEPAEAAAKVRAGEAVLVDIRNRSEFDEGHIPDAPWVPFNGILGRTEELRGERPVVLYCRTGSRSAIAASFLRADGIPDVHNLVGGYVAWDREKLPVELGAPATGT